MIVDERLIVLNVSMYWVPFQRKVVSRLTVDITIETKIKRVR